MTWLLDANLVIALLDRAHEHHERAEAWFMGIDRFATCPITQGAFVRYATRLGQSPVVTQTMLATLAGRDGHEFWPDQLPYVDVDLTRVIGHRQVTDAYLVALVQHQTVRARLATLDIGLAELYPDLVELV